MRNAIAAKDTNPIIPHWVGVVQRILHPRPDTAEHHLFPKSGPFAWNGLFGFYLPFATFWIWFFIMKCTIRRWLHRLDEEPEVPASATAA